MLIECAITYSEFSFVCVGPWTTNIDELRKVSNIYLLGRKDYSEVPRYIKYADLCIVPFKNNDITNSCDSLKILQYIAMHKKVLSTSYGSCNNFDSLVEISASHQNFVERLGVLMNEHNYVNIDRSSRLLNRHTWHNIAKNIISSI